jgi:ABC-type Fe3+-hydroxamate transport system substrate-binding protein
MLSFTDQTGRLIQLGRVPRRIVSLVPSQTELLFDLGLNEEVVGLTKFCVHPQQWLHTKTKVGGTKQLDIEKIRSLKPDLIIANKEENVKEQIEQLATEFPLWISDIATLEHAYEMIIQVAAMTGKERPALQLLSRIKSRFKDLPVISSKFTLKTCYLIWQSPYMAAGGGTFIDAMLHIAGFDNVFKHRARYPEVTVKEIETAGCQLLLLSSEPFPFRQKHKDEIQKELPGIRIELVDGEMFSWYGSRLAGVPGYFLKLREKVGELIV